MGGTEQTGEPSKQESRADGGAEQTGEEQTRAERVDGSRGSLLAARTSDLERARDELRRCRSSQPLSNIEVTSIAIERLRDAETERKLRAAWEQLESSCLTDSICTMLRVMQSSVILRLRSHVIARARSCCVAPP